MKIGKYFLAVVMAFASFGHAGAQINSEQQPFTFQAKRLIETLDFLGSAISPSDQEAINNAIAESDGTSVQKIETVLDTSIVSRGENRDLPQMHYEFFGQRNMCLFRFIEKNLSFV